MLKTFSLLTTNTAAPHLGLKVLLCGISLMISAVGWAQSCVVTLSQAPPIVIELYTSEGCSSCPPADRWLSTMVQQTRGKRTAADRLFIPLSLHVPYWDYIGWQDPYSQAQFAKRQYRFASLFRVQGVFTPQVIMNGVNHGNWRSHSRSDALPSWVDASAKSATEEAAMQLQLQLTATLAQAQLTVSGRIKTAAPVNLHWVVTEDQLVSAVASGENAGKKLAHDGVVRVWKKIEVATQARASTASSASKTTAPTSTDPTSTDPTSTDPTSNVQDWVTTENLSASWQRQHLNFYVIAENLQQQPLAAARIDCPLAGR